MSDVTTHILGPERSDPIVLLSDQGFRAEIPLDGWLTVDAPCTGTRDDLGPWPGKVVEFARSIYFVAEWTLASGERREMRRIDTSKNGCSVGDTFTVKHAGHSWTATVVAVEPATTVRIAYTIQSGAVRRRAFLRRGRA